MCPGGPERRRKPQVSQQNRRCPHLTSLISAHLCSEVEKKKKKGTQTGVNGGGTPQTPDVLIQC